METKLHPTFAKEFNQYFIRGWLIAVVLFFAGMIFLKNNITFLGWTCALGFGASIVWILSYLYYSLYHVKCPQCDSELKTEKDFSRRTWVAHCSLCRVTWDLGVGIKTGH